MGCDIKDLIQDSSRPSRQINYDGVIFRLENEYDIHKYEKRNSSSWLRGFKTAMNIVKEFVE